MTKKIASFIQDYLVLNVMIFSALAYLVPFWALSAAPYLNYFFAITMFCVGMLMPKKQVEMLRQKPTRAISGTAMQFFFMPLLSFLVVWIFRIDGDARTGILIAGAVPGAMASNLMSLLAGADVALSVSITSLSTIVSPILTPMMLMFYGGGKLELQFFSMVLSILWMVVIPVIAGYITKTRFEKTIEGVTVYLGAIASITIILIVSIVVASNREHILFSSLYVLAALIVLNFGGYLCGYGGGAILRWNVEARKTVAIEVGMQNAGLGTVLALKHFSKDAAIAPAIYTVLCLVTSSILVNFWEWRMKKKSTR
ncbi:MAG: bile acid:sodium symporter family protein [Candidatus Schekmanbacteria bacterium]|nr:bile acid:sodium symporter family protein [Candidatus Schekmanbacteria bacterium]